MTQRLYQILIFGKPQPEASAAMEATLRTHVAAFGMELGIAVTLAHGFGAEFDPTLTSAAIFFGAPGTALPEHDELVKLSVPIVPVITERTKAGVELPDCLKPINALVMEDGDKGMVRPTTAVLECLGLLPTQRRVFISYKQDESRDAAVQLFESLSALHFEVFLDTHSINVSTVFQEMLWHRMCDADVVLMLDTPKYFNSRWTRKEFGRANDKKIAMLQVVWPGHTPSRRAQLATPLMLQTEDFEGARLAQRALKRIAQELEVLRSKGTALRHAHLAGCLRTAVEDLGGAVNGVGPNRSVTLTLGSGARLRAYPATGVPTATTVHRITDPLAGVDLTPAVVVYDHVGISGDWLGHIKWLGKAVPSVRWIKSREATVDLSELGEA